MKRTAITIVASALAGVALTLCTAACLAPDDADVAPSTNDAAVAPPVVEVFHRPADAEPALGPVNEYDEGVLFCGVNAGVAVDVDAYGNSWAYCEPALALGEGR